MRNNGKLIKILKEHQLVLAWDEKVNRIAAVLTNKEKNTSTIIYADSISMLIISSNRVIRKKLLKTL